MKELKAKIEGFMVYAQNGLKNEKAFSRKFLNEIQTSQIEHESITSNDIAEMKTWLQSLENNQRKTMEDKFHNFTMKTEKDNRILLEKSQNTTNKCEAKLEEKTLKIEENELEIQALNDKLVSVEQNFTSLEKYVTEAVSIVKKEIFEKLRETITCDIPWEIFGNTCYLLSSEAMVWKDAWEFCNSKDSHLLEVDDSDERDFLVQKYRARNHTG